MDCDLYGSFQFSCATCLDKISCIYTVDLYVYSPKKVHTIHYISHTHFYINRNNVAICGANGHGGLQSFVYCSQFFLYLFIHHCNAQQAVNVKNIVVSKWHNIHKHTHHYLIWFKLDPFQRFWVTFRIKYTIQKHTVVLISMFVIFFSIRNENCHLCLVQLGTTKV